MKDEYGSVTIRFFNNAEPEVEFKGRIEPRDISQRSIYFLRMGYATMYIPERQKWERLQGRHRVQIFRPNPKHLRKAGQPSHGHQTGLGSQA